MSIRKINKKRLSRNFRLKHTPLKVLPLTTPGGRRILQKATKKPPAQTNQAPASSNVRPRSVECSLEPCAISGHGKKQGWRKAPLTFHPFVSARLKMNAMRWVFLSLIIALSIGALFIVLQDGFGSMRNIVIYGAMGFFTFFMGYFGTIFAKDLLDMVMEKRDSRNDVDLDA